VRKIALFTIVALTTCAVHAEEKPAKSEKRPTKMWTLTGPLGETPRHVTDACPLVVAGPYYGPRSQHVLPAETGTRLPSVSPIND